MIQPTMAFNGDKNLLDECLKLKNQFLIDTIIETGTHVGYSTKVFAEHFSHVHTIESKDEYFNRSQLYCSGHGNILFYKGSSIHVLPQILKRIGDERRILVYLDAHWEGEETPLLTELNLLRLFNIRPVLMIHDFQVPGRPELGYDTYHGQPYSWEWIKPHIGSVYKDKYFHYYNKEAHPESPVKRGCLFVIPN